MSLVWLLVAFALMKWLPESQRFVQHVQAHRVQRTELLRIIRANLFRICSVVFLSNMYIATGSIFQNRYLKDERGYSALLVALFTVATSAPASLGLIIGGRIADERGRRILGATMVPLGAFLLGISFCVSGTTMWVFAVIGGFAFGLSYPALAVYRGELFPTGVRSLAGGIIMTAALLGGSIGLIGAGRVLDAGASYGAVMMWLVVAPVIASIIVWLQYPETAHRELDEISHEN